MTVIETTLLILAVVAGCVALVVATMLLAELRWRRTAAASLICGAEACLRAHGNGPRQAW